MSAPCQPTPLKIYYRQIPKGYAGTLATVRHIIALIKAGVKDFCVRQTAIDILLANGIRPKDYRGEIAALFEWVKHNIRYTRDIHRVELLHTPRRMLELRAGDCDDMTILLATMLKSIGHPVRLVLVGFNPHKKKLFTHIYLEAYCKGWWIPLDPTMRHPMGWAPPATHKQNFNVN
ncbi:MAG: transglutaminase-like domain-containing protein [bacterium]